MKNSKKKGIEENQKNLSFSRKNLLADAYEKKPKINKTKTSIYGTGDHVVEGSFAYY